MRSPVAVAPASPLSVSRRPAVDLWAAGDADSARFAICADEGYVVWYNTFRADSGVHPAWTFRSADTVAAAKAIWLAGRIRADLQVPVVRLRLHVSNLQLDRPLLAVVAAKAGVALDIDKVTDNPAQDWCRAYGCRDWRETVLAGLID